MGTEIAKRRAAEAALKHVVDGQIIGLGSGTTMKHFIDLLSKKIERKKLNVEVAASSFQVYLEAARKELKVLDAYSLSEVDLTIDGADEIDSSLNLLKGGGAALTREKILAEMSKKYVIIADYTKLVTRIGEKHPIPIEILPFGWKGTIKRLSRFGRVEVRNCKGGKVGPVITDNGNLIVDLHLEREYVEIEKIERRIKNIVGVVEVGIFSGLADIAYIGYEDHVEILNRNR